MWLNCISKLFDGCPCFTFLYWNGISGELPVASTLVSESVETHERGRIVVLLESFWAVGWLIAALIAYFIIPDYGWRMAMLLSALPAVYALYLRSKLPEPTSSHISQKKHVYRFANQWH